MTDNQTIHVAFLNSYNLLMGNATFDEIVDSGLPMFAHTPEEETFDALNVIMVYFQSKEMYEYCADIKKIIEENYYPDGTSRIAKCKCEFPTIAKYTEKMVCSTCNNRLIK